MKEGDRIGFKAGVAQQLLLRSFSKFEQAAGAAAKRAEAEQAKKPPAEKKAEPAKKAPPAEKKAASKPAAATAPPPAAPAAAAAPAAETTSDVTAGEAMVKAAGAQSASHLSEQVGVPYNGGKTANYYWEQTLNDVTIHAPVPAGTRARDVVCVIGRSHLTLKLKGREDALVDDDFPCDARNGNEIWERVKTSESYWNVGEAKGEVRGDGTDTN